jgi:hypothetical protein
MTLVKALVMSRVKSSSGTKVFYYKDTSEKVNVVNQNDHISREIESDHLLRSLHGIIGDDPNYGSIKE